MSVEDITSPWRNTKLTSVEDEVADLNHVDASKGKEILTFWAVGKVLSSKLIIYRGLPKGHEEGLECTQKRCH